MTTPTRRWLAAIGMTVALAGCGASSTPSTSTTGTTGRSTGAAQPAPHHHRRHHRRPKRGNAPTGGVKLNASDQKKYNQLYNAAAAAAGKGTAAETPGSSSHATDAQFCTTHSCIPAFPNGNGTIVQCVDGQWGHSGGLSGACSGHGGAS